ncbi:NADPH-dependent FMN reductase [Roseateles asaccharophilus]|uniref:FMN reductase n=1 Tax=Roseateles asaccharophilus TaxID=582607 RepID=A0ABU2AFQ8_9BURK|nr:NADPH-dependent FMN reductase [Roseateles asaccharophilus]MDR7336045.1 FMN reductase [Roseateles asaccharophilus]
MHILSISGSPSERSRSAWLTQFALTRLEGVATGSRSISVRELPATALLVADTQHVDIAEAIAAVAQADVVVIGTPIYKAAYSGLLKLFLDLLPPDALRGKTVLPLATGGSAAHLLALDYALKPVLSALGARHVLDAVFATDAQLQRHEAGGYVLEADLVARLDRAVAPLAPRRVAEPLTSC